MQKKQSKIMTVLCIVMLLVLLAGAFYVPEVLNRIYDNRILEQVNTKKLDFELYELKYTSFEEKVHAIGMAVANGEKLELLELAQKNDEEEVSVWQNLNFSEEEFNKEIELLLQDGMQIELDLEQIVLSGCKLYTILGTGESSDSVLTGIQVYELSYIPKFCMDTDLTEEELKYFECLRLYVDAEFYKIYAFGMSDLGKWADFSLREAGCDEENIMDEYWGIDCKMSKLIYEDAWDTDTSWGKMYGFQLFFREVDGYIYVWRGGETGKRANVIYMGMQPFFDNLSTMTAKIIGTKTVITTVETNVATEYVDIEE